MKKIKKLIKSKDDFDKFIFLLVERANSNKPISDNGMRDGIIIGLMLSTNFTCELFTNEQIGRVLDGTLQKLEKISVWLMRKNCVI